jgi:two-component system, NarL family, response regulator NreC
VRPSGFAAQIAVENYGTALMLAAPFGGQGPVSRDLGRSARVRGRMGGADEITVVLADDHAVVRSGLRLLLDQAGLHVLAEAGDADSAIRSVLGHKPSVLVLDLNMPGKPTSLEAIPRISEVSPGTRVVILTMQEDPVFAREALRAGAAGYVLKEAAESELVEAVRRAAAGGTYLNPRLGAALATAASAADSPPDGLTDREAEVLRLVALGHTNAEIADKLYLSVRTVESHRARIGQKLRISTRAELVRYALDRGLLEDRD